MDDPFTRLLIVALVVAVAVGVGMVSRRGMTVRRRPLDVAGPPGLTLLVAPGCGTCDRVREALTEVVGENGFREVSFADSPELFTQLGIGRVPTLVAVTGRGSWKVEGAPGARRLRRWLADPGGP